MTVYIDRSRKPYRNMIMCHMVSDSIAELFAMAQKIGMRAQWFQPSSFPHFDVAAGRKISALQFGAVEIDRRELARFMRSYNLRLKTDDAEAEMLRRLSAYPEFKF
jgi:hypothetical protein